MSSSSHLHPEVEFSTTPIDLNSSQTSLTISNNSTSSSSSSSSTSDHNLQANNSHQQQLLQQHQHQSQHQYDRNDHPQQNKTSSSEEHHHQYLRHKFDFFSITHNQSDISGFSDHSNKFERSTSNSLADTTEVTSIVETPSTTSNSTTSSLMNVKTEPQSLSNFSMNVESSHHGGMIPSAHSSELHLQYSLPTTKNLNNSSPTNMALNFSHDLLHQTTSQHSQVGLHHEQDNKSHLGNSLDLNSGGLMQSAVGMNMWKNTMSLNHFRHPALPEHNFLPSTDANSFPTWTHAAASSLGQQGPNMTHHILDSQHLISYPQHQRTLSVSGQDLVGATLKSQPCTDQAPFLLNSINHHASTSQNSSSSHQTTQPAEDLNIRSQSLDQLTYNLSMNDNQQFYNSSRSENRSHSNAINSSSLVPDRSIHMSLSNHSGHQHHYHGVDHPSLQPTTSHHVAGSSSSAGASSKNVGSFRCPTCHEVFNLRTQFQSHLKTHSQDKSSKAKFSCELCGHSFSQKTSLNRHMKSHTGERPFPCDICGKAFSEKERLKIHMRTHTGEKPFSCTVCGKSFSQKSTVKRHQTVHTGEKKFKCDCGKGFANRGNLIAHIKTRGSNHFE